jgi:hypothetical protein
VGYDQEAAPIRSTEKDEALFTLRMIWVSDGDRERVREGSNCLREGHAVLSAILLILASVPFKGRTHFEILHQAGTGVT